MAAAKQGYLSDLRRHLHLEPREGEEILQELRTHVEERTQELIDAGVSPREASNRALDSLGASSKIASQLYQVHSRGSWYHTALAVLPHLLLALMFGLHLWTSPGWVVLMLSVALMVSIFGWRMGRPRWTYPWLDYCLVIPIVSWGLAMSAVSYGAWAVVSRGSLPFDIPIYLASFAYFVFSLWLVIRIVSKVARPDWVMASLAILPVPFLAYWFFYFYNSRDALDSTVLPLQEVDSSAAIVFLILAAATAVFFRIGRRLVRVALLAITAPSAVVLAWLSYQGGPGHVAVFLYSAVSLALLLSPALFDIKDNQPQQHLVPLRRTRGSARN